MPGTLRFPFDELCQASTISCASCLRQRAAAAQAFEAELFADETFAIRAERLIAHFACVSSYVKTH